MSELSDMAARIEVLETQLRRYAYALELVTEREGSMNFQETKDEYNYYFNSKQSRGGWIITVTTDVKLQVGGLEEVTMEEFTRMSKEATDRLQRGEPAVARIPMFSFFVGQTHTPRWDPTVTIYPALNMAHLEQVTDDVIKLLPDTVRIRELLKENFIE